MRIRSEFVCFADLDSLCQIQSEAYKPKGSNQEANRNLERKKVGRTDCEIDVCSREC